MMSKIVLAFVVGISLLSISVTSASAQLIEKKTLSLAAAKKAAAAAEAEAVKNNWTMVISVLDDGGNLSISSGWTALS
jgi:glc operon protein GlcG